MTEFEVPEHVEKSTTHSVMVTPGHEDREESAEFRQAKKQLKEDGHYQCWICECREKLQVHHFWAEWSEGAITDFEVLLSLVGLFDIYGYSAKMNGKPVTSVDDVRQMMVLCQEHHTGTDSVTGTPTGIHNMPFPEWIMQKVAKNGIMPVPQEGQTVEDVIKAIKEFQDKEGNAE